jgi:hypothetical protein
MFCSIFPFFPLSAKDTPLNSRRIHPLSQAWPVVMLICVFWKGNIMETLYKSLLTGADTLTEQLKSHLFSMTEPEGPTLIFVDNQGQFCANHPNRVSFLNECPDTLAVICAQIDDGYDPCVYTVDKGCIIGTQLVTEETDCGRFLIYLPGYRSETVQVNMDMFELVFAQMQLICELIEKNNRLHHRQLSDLSERSTTLCIG